MTAGQFEMVDLEHKQVEEMISRFVGWLDGYGEVSYDHQSFYASDWGRWAKRTYYEHPKLGILAVAPMVFCEALFPPGRKLFWKPQRFPIADAHYAMGFAFLAEAFGREDYYQRAVHFLEVLKDTRSPGYAEYAWGYPFNWETSHGTMWAGTPMITTVPYVYEAFREVHRIDGDRKWLTIMRSIAQHVLNDYSDHPISKTGTSCSYIPALERKWSGVVNASAYRACVLTQAAADLSSDEYLATAEQNLQFVLGSQKDDGSWQYSEDGCRDFVDHFHTCFVLKALAKIERLTSNPACTDAIQRGIRYYLGNLVDEQHLPKPFSRRPRLTVYRREAYDLAECINLAVLLRKRYPELNQILSSVLSQTQWQRPDGSFRSRQLLLGGWDNTPMHRWASSQLFRSLCFLLDDSKSSDLEGKNEVDVRYLRTV